MAVDLVSVCRSEDQVEEVIGGGWAAASAPLEGRGGKDRGQLEVWKDRQVGGSCGEATCKSPRATDYSCLTSLCGVFVLKPDIPGRKLT